MYQVNAEIVSKIKDRHTFNVPLRTFAKRHFYNSIVIMRHNDMRKMSTNVTQGGKYPRFSSFIHE